MAALREIGFWLERSRSDTYRVQAYRKAADTVEALSAAERTEREADNRWADLPGLGPKTITVISQAAAGGVPDYLQGRRTAGAEPLATGGEKILAVLRGDLHTHTTWSDGGSPLPEMVQTARRLGREYLAITDHSPRLKVAHGLSAERLREQIGLIDDLNAELAGEFTVLRGIEVDILDDGRLDQESALLDQLDIVVASVHSKLRIDSESMTHRMVAAIANPRTNILGHCTGRLVEGSRGTRPESTFDAEVVFAACLQFDVAVEINSRPERRDPPSRLLALAQEMGCKFSIDTDAHAPGQLDFSQYGAQRAAAAGIEPEMIIDTWPVEQLVEWAAAKKRRR
ncbi:putative hydrolase [Naumannella halotolerans]|uniref:Putative hydrolase n=1 Tax=Naumannella halotolerans TaxID=993414 RepID=A0A4R7JA53_9ACTN|nr:putative hydrolase [Naumannella halotolerans]